MIANRFVRATEDVDLLIPDDPANDSRLLAALRGLGAVRQRDTGPVRDEHRVGQGHLSVLDDAGLIAFSSGRRTPA